MSVGVFFVFKLACIEGISLYALIKYDNEDVVRYIINEDGVSKVPQLDRFQESFVRKPEAMQKVALIRLANEKGGHLLVRDRSNVVHISDYFEGFLLAKRVNNPADLTKNLVVALKDTFKTHKKELPEEIANEGVKRIYDVISQNGTVFDPDNCEPLLTAIFGVLDEKSPVRRTLVRKLKDHGVSEETFAVNTVGVERPRRRVLATAEGTEITYDVENRPDIRDRADGRKEIVIVTQRVTRDDVDLEGNSRGG